MTLAMTKIATPKTVTTGAASSVLQRKCACESRSDHEDETTRALQRKAMGPASPSVTPGIVYDVLNTSGQPLEPSARSQMEPRFGHDFSRVRIHTDDRAAQSAQSVHALAYTVGQHIVFDRGQYSPASSAGQHLLAHELTHVIQQQRIPAAGGHDLEVGVPDDSSEYEADQIASQVFTGKRVSVEASSSGIVQRQQAAPVMTQPAGGQVAARPQSQPAAPTRPERESLDPAGRPGRPVRAEVYRSPSGGPANLTVTLRCSVVFAERPLGENPGRPIPLPTPTQQATWRKNFTERISKAWSFKHYLDLDGPCQGERPRAVVNFRAIDRGSPDVTIYVYSWTPSGWRSYVRGNVMHLDIGDVDANFGSGQVVAAHETGHSLGLSHIGCDTNDFWCYGTFNDAADIMGGGPTISARDYQVFAEIMQQVTGCRWKVTPASGPPHNYLPTALGFAMGVLGAIAGGVIGFGLGGPLGAFIGAAVGGLGLGFGFGALAGALGLTAS